MFERFTEAARRVVVEAQEESRLLNHSYIGTEHILLGLLRQGEGVAAKALVSLGISLEDVRRRVEEIIGRGTSAPGPHVPFTPRSKKVLELSLREAVELGHSYIGTEHILLGIMREREGVAAQVLVQAGADAARVRDVVLGMLEGAPAQLPDVEEAIQASERPPPRCAACGSSLFETMRYRSLTASEEGDGGTRDVVVFYCGRCGTAVGSSA